jgi:hypothetical protein
VSEALRAERLRSGWKSQKGVGFTDIRFRITNAAFAGAASLLPAQPSFAAEGALETTTVRIAKTPAICLAPLYVSEELLRAEATIRRAARSGCAAQMSAAFRIARVARLVATGWNRRRVWIGMATPPVRTAGS